MMVLSTRYDVLLPIKSGSNRYEHPVTKEEIQKKVTDPVITSCCEKVFPKEDLISHITHYDNIYQTCPNSVCSKPLSVVNLGIHPRMSNLESKEFQIYPLEKTTHGQYKNPLSGRVVQEEANHFDYVTGCCMQLFSSKELKEKYLSLGSDLGSCPHCDSSLDLSNLGFTHLSDTKEKIELFEKVALAATAVAIGALYFSMSALASVAIGVMLVAVGLGIIHFGFAKVDLPRDIFHLNNSTRYLFCAGSVVLGAGVAIAATAITTYAVTLGIFAAGVSLAGSSLSAN